MQAALGLVLDVLIAAALAAVAIIAVTGGGSFTLLDSEIRAHSVGNPLIALALLVALRAWLSPEVPWLGIPRLAPTLLSEAFRHTLARTGTPVAWPRAAALAGAFALASLGLKLAIAWTHPGFFSGDDVEIHEMTLGVLWRRDWPVWELRSAFYPMTFIYPVQWLLAGLGVTDAGTMVTAGRAVVASVSTAAVLLLFAIARRPHGAIIALIAAAILAFNHLSVTFGATELPRPIGAVFVLGAFGALLRGSASGAVLAGGLVGIAAALRFSELLFVVPGIAHLAVERRRTHAIAFGAAALGTAAAIQAAADALYWGAPLASAREIIDYTLVRRQSSRGFEPIWQYLTSVPAWSDWVLVGLALSATRRATWRLALWTWTPVIMLSLLPHKEPRYLLPIMPLLSLLAAIGIARTGAWLTDTRVSAARAQRFAFLIAAALGASTLHHVSRWHVRRDDGAVELARYLAAGPPAGLAVEQLWRLGGRLYLGDLGPLRDLDAGALSGRETLAELRQAREFQWIAIREDTCTRLACRDALRSPDLLEHAEATGLAQYVVFVRRR